MDDSATSSGGSKSILSDHPAIGLLKDLEGAQSINSPVKWKFRYGETLHCGSGTGTGSGSGSGSGTSG